MTPPTQAQPTTHETLTPFLLWTPEATCANGAALACPQCARANLHLGIVHIAVPTDDDYTPTVALNINTVTGAIDADDPTARALHGTANRGAMLSIGYWCEHGCQGRIELRVHKGHLYAALDHEPPFEPADLPSV